MEHHTVSRYHTNPICDKCSQNFECHKIAWNISDCARIDSKLEDIYQSCTVEYVSIFDVATPMNKVCARLCAYVLH